MGMELGAGFPEGVLDGAATDPALLDFAGAAVDHVAPFRFCVGVRGGVEAGDEPVRQIGPVLFRQRQHFGDLFSGHAHAGRVWPASPSWQASLRGSGSLAG